MTPELDAVAAVTALSTTIADAKHAMREAGARLAAQDARIATLTAENADLAARVAFLEKMRELAWAEAAT